MQNPSIKNDKLFFQTIGSGHIAIFPLTSLIGNHRVTSRHVSYGDFGLGTGPSDEMNSGYS